MIKVYTELVWDGEKNITWLKGILAGRLTDAISIYEHKVKQRLNKWGSIPALGFTRIRKKHSQPGEPPFRQTGNLYWSVKTSINKSRLTAICGTTVPYAQDLEFGGVAKNYGQGIKRHTVFRLVNPLRGKSYVIAPRPAWLPTFGQVVNRMFLKIAKG